MILFLNKWAIMKSLKKNWPSKEYFYKSLTGEKFSYKESDHVLKVWNKFEMKTMKDYHDLYYLK